MKVVSRMGETPLTPSHKEALAMAHLNYEGTPETYIEDARKTMSAHLTNMAPPRPLAARGRRIVPLPGAPREDNNETQ